MNTPSRGGLIPKHLHVHTDWESESCKASRSAQVGFPTRHPPFPNTHAQRCLPLLEPCEFVDQDSQVKVRYQVQSRLVSPPAEPEMQLGTSQVPAGNVELGNRLRMWFLSSTKDRRRNRWPSELHGVTRSMHEHHALTRTV